jgi:hypothetical protein
MAEPDYTPDTPLPAATKDLLFILGVGRSGTSALARLLSLCGCTLPHSLKDANAANPTGYWEPLDALKLNDTFLLQHEASYFDPTLRLQGEWTVPEKDRADFVTQIRSFLSQCPATSRLVIKDPRITALFGFWLEAARQESFRVKIIIPIRHPQEVVASLAAWVKASPELLSALWLKYNLLSERNSRDLPRVFVDYAALVSDWRAQVDRIVRTLALDLEVGDGASIDTFLTGDLHRKRSSGMIAEPFGYPWLSQTYAILKGAARDQPLDMPRLDEIFSSYRTCERAFRVSLDDSRSKLPKRAPRDGIITWNQAPA